MCIRDRWSLQTPTQRVHAQLRSDGNFVGIAGTLSQDTSSKEKWICRFAREMSAATKLHSDCGSKFIGRVAALKHGLVSSWNGSHSPQSNGRTEVLIRIVRALARRKLVGSHLPIDLWSKTFAVQHAVEALRVKRLRLRADVSSAEWWPFGTYVASRVPGAVKSFVI
eukprot:6303905-Amphidinium_carterae.2